jgi:hypothetical protein
LVDGTITPMRLRWLMSVSSRGGSAAQARVAPSAARTSGSTSRAIRAV